MEWQIHLNKEVNLETVGIERPEFHSFSEDEFGSEGYLADSWVVKINVVVDQDGDGIIKLESATNDKIVSALTKSTDLEIVDAAEGKDFVIRKVYICIYDETEKQNLKTLFLEAACVISRKNK